MIGPRSSITSTAGGLRLTLERTRLLVEDGPDLGTELVLADRPVVIGNGPDCDLRLTDPRVGPSHCVLRPPIGPGAWRLLDLGGPGGTWIDRVEIEAAPWKPGARVVLGGTELTLRSGPVEIAPAPDEGGEFEGLVGRSPAMAALFGLVRKLAELDVPILLTGESGTGKEKLARALHRLGSAPAAPYEVVDCTLLDREHLRSELFGHVRGAFTGATGARRGAFERADGGTLLLDEIGELPLEVQSALLRVLQEGEVRPLGAETSQRVRVRVVAATHRDLAALVATGHFRADLFYRLAAVVIEVPPLRSRGTDVLVLAQRFLPRGFSLSATAEAVLLAHPWPGNVRELEHAIRRAAALANSRVLAPADLRLGAGPAGPAAGEAPARLAPGSPGAISLSPTLAESEAQQIRTALAACEGNRTEAARRLGIARSTLYLKIRSMGLTR